MLRSGKADIVQIWAAVTNTDLNAGEGIEQDYSYHLTKEEALIGAEKIGPMGSNGSVEKARAVRFDDGQYFLLARYANQLPTSDAPHIFIAKIDAEGITKARQASARQKALDKLTTLERQALGV